MTEKKIYNDDTVTSQSQCFDYCVSVGECEIVIIEDIFTDLTSRFIVRNVALVNISLLNLHLI